MGNSRSIKTVEILARRIEALGLADAPLEGAHGGASSSRRAERSCELPKTNLIRTAYFCSGCPHNTSTRTVEGSMAFTGVGCYGLVPMLMPDRKTEWAAQMGAEGTLWVGLQSFVDVPHAFQNLGDGTYFHSGILAVRQAVAVKANMTYKLLYNDAVAMTGGQPIDGKLSVEDMANQLYWEGVRPIVIVTDEPEKYPASVSWPQGHDGSGTARNSSWCKRRLQQVKGVSAIIYDQTCAAEKRRRRKTQHGFRIRPSACSSTKKCARGAATATRSRIASACSRSTRNSGASARSTSRTATRISAVSTASAHRS